MAHEIYEDFAERYDLFYGKFGEHNPEVIARFSMSLAENRDGEI